MLKYKIGGSGKETLVWVHGFMEDQEMWIDSTRHFGARYRWLRVDLPGFGKSKLKGKVSLTKMAQMVNEVLEHENLNKIYWLGHSMGGYVGLEFASKHPEKLLGFGLIHSHPFADSEEVINKRKQSISVIDGGNKDAYIRILLDSMFEKEAEEAKIQMYERAKYISKSSIINALEAMIERRDHSDTLYSMTCPVLCLIGLKDALMPREYALKQVVLAETTLVRYFEEVGHVSIFEDTKGFRNGIDQFLDLCELLRK